MIAVITKGLISKEERAEPAATANSALRASRLISNVRQRKMIPVLPIFAEVTDKEPSVWFFCACAFSCVLISWQLMKWKKWLAVVAVPLAILSAALVLEEVRNPDVGPAIVRELGYSYVVVAYVSAGAPFIAIMALLSRRKKEPNQSLQPTRYARG